MDTLANRISLCEVYAQIEAGDYEKWVNVLQFIKNQLPNPFPDQNIITEITDQKLVTPAYADNSDYAGSLDE